MRKTVDTLIQEIFGGMRDVDAIGSSKPKNGADPVEDEDLEPGTGDGTNEDPDSDWDVDSDDTFVDVDTPDYSVSFLGVGGKEEFRLDFSSGTDVDTVNNLMDIIRSSVDDSSYKSVAAVEIRQDEDGFSVETIGEVIGNAEFADKYAKDLEGYLNNDKNAENAENGDKEDIAAEIGDGEDEELGSSELEDPGEEEDAEEVEKDSKEDDKK